MQSVYDFEKSTTHCDRSCASVHALFVRSLRLSWEQTYQIITDRTSRARRRRVTVEHTNVSQPSSLLSLSLSLSLSPQYIQLEGIDDSSWNPACSRPTKQTGFRRGLQPSGECQRKMRTYRPKSVSSLLILFNAIATVVCVVFGGLESGCGCSSREVLEGAANGKKFWVLEFSVCSGEVSD